VAQTSTTHDQIALDVPVEDTTVATEVSWQTYLTSSRFRRLSREFIWIGLGQAAAVLGALVGVRVLTAILPPEAYGRLALGMTVAAFVNQTVLGPLSGAATRFFAPACEAGMLGGYFAAVKSLLVRATGAIVLVAFVLCLGLAATGQSQWIALSLAALCFALLSGYNGVLNGMQNAARQRAVVALHQALVSWGRFALAAGFVIWLGASSTMAMLGYALAILIVLASQGCFFRRTLSTRMDARESTLTCERRWRADLFGYAWPFSVWGLPAWAQLASDRWALQGFASISDVGRYVTLYQLGYYPITIATNLMVQVITPVFFQRAGDASDTSRLHHVFRLNRKVIIVALVLTGGASLLAFALHNVIFRLLVAPQYRTVSWMLPGVVLAGGLFASGQIAVVSLLSQAQTRKLILPKVGTAICGVLLNMIGAALYGMPGVVAAMIVAGAVYLIWILCLSRACHSQTLGETGQ